MTGEGPEPPSGGESRTGSARRAASDLPLGRHTMVMAAGTALSRITGFLRLSAMAAALGVAGSRLADAYNVANNTPNIVYELVLGGVLTSVVVPVFVEWLERRGQEEAWEAARAVLSIALVGLAAIAVVTIIAAPWIVRLYTVRLGEGPAADAERAAATFFLRWFMPQIVFYGAGAVATALLNTHRRFAAPMFAPVLNNLVVIATMLTFIALQGPDEPTPDGISTVQRYVLAIGTTLGVAAMTVALLPSLRRLGFRFRFRAEWRHEAVGRITRLALWTFVYVLASQVGLLVVIVLATGEQGYTTYAAAFILFQLPHAIFAVSIMTALLPALSSRWTDGDTAGFRLTLAGGVRTTAFIVVPAAIGYIALARPVVRLLLEHGATDPAEGAAVADVLVLFAVGLFSFSASQLLLRAFYAMQDTRTPALIHAAAVGVNTVANLILFQVLGVRGLALGHAVAYTFSALLTVAIMRRRLGGLEGRLVVRGLAKVAVGGAATGGAAFLASRGLAAVVDVQALLGQVVQVLGSVLIGLLVFVAMALLLRMEDLQTVRDLLARRLRRRP